MIIYAKQSTAKTIKIGKFLDDTDGKTAETGLTIAYTDVLLSKEGGILAAKSETSSCAHDAAGYYNCALNVTDLNTLGDLFITVHVSGALPVEKLIRVLPANVYDAMFSGTDILHADAVQVAGSGVSGVADFKADISNLVSDITTAVWAAGSRTLTGFGTLIASIWSNASRTLSAGTKDSEIDSLVSGQTTIISNQSTINDNVLSVSEKADIILTTTSTTIPEALEALSTFDPDADELENAMSYSEIFRVMAAILFGNQENGAFRNLANTKNRAAFTIDVEADTRTRTSIDGAA